MMLMISTWWLTACDKLINTWEFADVVKRDKNQSIETTVLLIILLFYWVLLLWYYDVMSSSWNLLQVLNYL